jgi:putative addiction module killer protein
MELHPRTVLNYILPNGKRPLKEWLNELHQNTQIRIRKRLIRLGAGDLGGTKHIEDGMFELRLDFGPGYRIYFGMDGKEIILLLLGGDKSTQRNDIKKASEYWNEYKERKISSD